MRAIKNAFTTILLLVSVVASGQATGSANLRLTNGKEQIPVEGEVSLSVAWFADHAICVTDARGGASTTARIHSAMISKKRSGEQLFFVEGKGRCVFLAGALHESRFPESMVIKVADGNASKPATNMYYPSC